MIVSLLEHIVRQIVIEPNHVVVRHNRNETTAYRIEIVVTQQDRGRVIGRNGHTIRALRALAYALSDKDQKVIVEIL